MDDHQELAELPARYADGIDRRDLSSVTELFTDDGVLRVDDAPPRLGRSAVGQALEWVRRYDRTFHLLGQQLVEVAGEEATGHVYCLAHHITGGSLELWAIRYEDRYRRVDGSWRFAERWLRVQWRSK